MSHRPLGGVFALMNRSLRTDDRIVRTHLFRFSFVALTYLMLTATQRSAGVFGAPGLNMFRLICFLNFYCITLACISVFSTAITEEKEDMTLGLLKMAGISPLSLLLGKSMPRLLAAIVLLSAQFPFTMLAITLGGVSLHQVLAAYFALLAYLILCANLALFASVVCLRSRAASVLTGLILGIYFFGPSLANAIKQALIYYDWLATGGGVDRFIDELALQVRATSAYRRIGVILTTGFRESAVSFQVITNAVGGMLLLFLSWLVFERCTRNEKPASESRGLLTRRLGANRGLGPKRAWDAALSWKDFHFIAGGKAMVLSKFVLFGSLIGLIIWSQINARISVDADDVGAMLMTIGLMASMIELGVHASRVFYTEVKWKTLSSIAMLPMSMGQVARAKLLGTTLGLTPAVSYFALGVLLAPDIFGEAISDMLDEPGAWYAVSQYVLFLHLAAALSLYVKWGAFPLAIGGVYIGNIVLMFLMMRGSNEGVLGFLAFVTFLVCVVLELQIVHRLRTLAAS